MRVSRSLWSRGWRMRLGLWMRLLGRGGGGEGVIFGRVSGGACRSEGWDAGRRGRGGFGFDCGLLWDVEDEVGAFRFDGSHAKAGF